MLLIATAFATVLLLVPASTAPVAAGPSALASQPTDFSAAKKKKAKTHKAPKVEYMRAVPAK
jgi:hypothetical protein